MGAEAVWKMAEMGVQWGQSCGAVQVPIIRRSFPPERKTRSQSDLWFRRCSIRFCMQPNPIVSRDENSRQIFRDRSWPTSFTGTDVFLRSTRKTQERI